MPLMKNAGAPRTPSRLPSAMLASTSAIMARALADRLADAGACTECAACEQACTQHLNIIDRLKEILSPQIEIREVNHHINDITFGRIAAEMMDAMVQKK